MNRPHVLSPKGTSPRPAALRRPTQFWVVHVRHQHEAAMLPPFEEQVHDGFARHLEKIIKQPGTVYEIKLVADGMKTAVTNHLAFDSIARRRKTFRYVVFYAIHSCASYSLSQFELFPLFHCRCRARELSTRSFTQGSFGETPSPQRGAGQADIHFGGTRSIL
jgi:hypothetical protein